MRRRQHAFALLEACVVSTGHEEGRKEGRGAGVLSHELNHAARRAERIVKSPGETVVAMCSASQGISGG